MKLIREATSHNKKLDAFLESLRSGCRNSKSLADLDIIAKKIEDYSKASEFKHNHAKAFYFTAFSGITAAILWYALGLNSSNLSPDNSTITVIFGLVVPWGLVIIGLVVLANSYFSKRGYIQEVSNKLLLKSHLIHNNLESPSFSGRDLWISWRNRFMGFDRGDESRFIDHYYKGRYDLDEIHIDYELFRFHYVIVQRRSVTKWNSITKKNETKTEEVRSTRYRYGMVLDFPYANGICISGEGYRYPVKWTTTSEQFNDLLEVTADDQMACAKVLQPSVVLGLIEK